MAAAPTILITGGSGQVGGQLRRTLAGIGNVVAPTRAELDLSSADSIRSMMRSLRPQWIVNPAAYTAVDKAESEPDAAFTINRDAPAVLAEEAKKLDAAMIHFSTDYVFDGMKSTPYVESDAPNPLGIYGASKLAGERAVQASGVAHVILRTSWVYGAEGGNFLQTILRLAREREELRIVSDQHGAPTWSFDLATATAAIIMQGENLADTGGIYHACSSSETTWYGFADAALQIARAKQPQQKFARLVPIPSSEYPTPAKRPQNSRLDCTKLRDRFGVALPPWQTSMAKVMEELLKS